MGLREINAARTRELIVDGAMELFFEHGYDATTMEDIAGHVGIGISTLYRYFPTKDQLRHRPDRRPGPDGGRASRPAPDELAGAGPGPRPDPRSWRTPAPTPSRAKDFQRLFEETPRLATRLVEWLFEAHTHLAQALAARRGLPADDLSSAASAWLVIFVLQRVDHVHQTGDQRDGVEIAAEVMAQLEGSAPLTRASSASPAPTQSA